MTKRRRAATDEELVELLTPSEILAERGIQGAEAGKLLRGLLLELRERGGTITGVEIEVDE